MPRRGLISRREVGADPLYNSALVTKFINTMMYGGKRATSQGIVYDALGVVQQKGLRGSGCGIVLVASGVVYLLT